MSHQPSMVADYWGYTIIHDFVPDHIHRDFAVGSRLRSGMVETSWCKFCGKNRDHVNHHGTILPARRLT